MNKIKRLLLLAATQIKNKSYDFLIIILCLIIIFKLVDISERLDDFESYLLDIHNRIENMER